MRLLTMVLALAACTASASPYHAGGARKNVVSDYLTDLSHRWTFDSDLTDSVGTNDFSAVNDAAAAGGVLTQPQIQQIYDGTPH